MCLHIVAPVRNTFLSFMPMIFNLISLIAVMLLATSVARGQSQEAKKVADQVYKHNNNLQYDKSQECIRKFLGGRDITCEDRYYAYLSMSFTYKRLFDYESVLTCLDSAAAYGQKTSKKEYFTNNIDCQKALALFDISQYEEAKVLMDKLSANHYRHIDSEHQSKLLMQEAYLLYLGKEYGKAETYYLKAVQKMKRSCVCDLPMVYGKMLELYSETGKTGKLGKVYTLAMHSADSCNIIKYKMYASEMMSKASEKAGQYKNAFYYGKIYDSIAGIYQQNMHLSEIKDLEKKYEAEKTQRIQHARIRKSEARLLLFAVLSAILLLGIIACVFWYRYQNLIRSRKDNLRYTRQLFESIELERRRIAADLHDSVGHELLALKSLAEADSEAMKEKIEDVIQDVRSISRNLHPVLFETLGLKMTLENLIERMQAQHNICLIADIQYQNELGLHAEVQLYRIIQEALSNAVRHAGSVAVKIELYAQGSHLFLLVMDSGKGFNVKEMLYSGKAFGLLSIITRSQSLGGGTDIHSTKGRTVIEVKIPFHT